MFRRTLTPPQHIRISVSGEGQVFRRGQDERSTSAWYSRTPLPRSQQGRLRFL